MPAITGWMSQDPRNQGTAKTALEALHHAYPGHSWFVRIDGGVLVVYNYQVDGRHGMVKHLSQISGDHTTFVTNVVQAAGELLERARLRRGEATGEIATEVDGIPKKKRRHLVPLRYY